MSFNYCPGELSGRDVPHMKNGPVQLMIITDTVDERNALMDSVRDLALQRRIKEVSLDTSLHVCTWKLSCLDFPPVNGTGNQLETILVKLRLRS